MLLNLVLECQVKVPNSFDKFVDMKYNNSKEWGLLKGYKREIQTGNLTPLADFKLFKNISTKIDTKLIGTTAINGVTIKSKSTHFISRIIGSIEQKRNSVNLDDVYDALLNGKVGTVRIDKNGQKSQKLFNDKVSVSINPDTGNLIQVNPYNR